MNDELELRYIAALRSGKYKPNRLAMHAADGSMCPIGVLCEVADPKGWQLLRSGDYYVPRDRGLIRRHLTEAEEREICEIFGTHGTLEAVANQLELVRLARLERATSAPPAQGSSD